ncbi:lipopolysaccharide biosynthesis protein [Stutzerimonas nitrititolerans]|uniref:lipopolysaccharide biosynthesis protein n=1 Tax=Stutzerimonas nitrititolerans TaxID=2482751 RepID=UPI0028A77407|nr:hypothetical protein [Stutzerimonas nitrititolerans]
MSSGLLSRVFSVALRVGVLVAKFLLIIALANYFEPEDVGMYGLFVGTVGYFVFAAGFDFYVYSNRELISTAKERWREMLRDQAVFYLVAYIVVMPFLLGLFYFNVLPIAYAGWFIVILVVEHLTQEATRLAVAISRPLLSSVISFVRAGLWVVVLVVWMYFFPEHRTLDILFGFWLVGGLLAFLLSLSVVLSLDKTRSLASINWQWIKLGIKVAFPFFLGTMALHGIFIFDRYAVKFISSLEILGAYVLFLGIANALMSFLSAGVFIFYYPKMIEAYKEKNRNLFFSALRSMGIQVLVFSGVFSLVVMVCIDPLLIKVGKPVYMEYSYILPWLLLAFSLQAFSMLPHYALYAAKNDRPIIVSQFISLPLFLVFVVLLARCGVDGLAVPASLSLIFAFMLIWKTYYCLKHRKTWFHAEG